MHDSESLVNNASATAMLWLVNSTLTRSLAPSFNYFSLAESPLVHRFWIGL